MPSEARVYQIHDSEPTYHSDQLVARHSISLYCISSTPVLITLLSLQIPVAQPHPSQLPAGHTKATSTSITAIQTRLTTQPTAIARPPPTRTGHNPPPIALQHPRAPRAATTAVVHHTVTGRRLPPPAPRRQAAASPQRRHAEARQRGAARKARLGGNEQAGEARPGEVRGEGARWVDFEGGGRGGGA